MSEYKSDMYKLLTEQEPYVRDYEMSVWTLQDSYIATLKWSGIEHKGQIQEGKIEIVDDGTENLSFKIPMYLYMPNGDILQKIENPLWYTTKQSILGNNNANEQLSYSSVYGFIEDNYSMLDNSVYDTYSEGILIKDMRKIKVIFNKTLGTAQEKANAGERVFEFLITKVSHEHENDQTYCVIEAEGLAFHELGKQGYKIELSSDLLLDRYNKVVETEGCWYDNFHNRHTELPEPTLDYWMNDIGIEKLPINTDDINPQKWYYKVEMDYSNHSLLPGGAVRRTDKIYEDSYVTSWDDSLAPIAVSEVQEKMRYVDANESNKYNLTQTIAETFEIFCRYEYSYDQNYNIIGRTIVFYNNFIKDTSPVMELTYPHTSLKITREYDSTDITTKMFVRPESDDSSVTGEVSIIDTDANPTHEDWILNFDYLYKIGTISQEQYDAIKPYQQKIRKLNCGDLTAIVAAKERSKRLTRISDNTYSFTGQFNDNDVVILNNDEYRCMNVDQSNHRLTLVLRSDDSIRGLSALQEQLIAKSDRKITVDAKYAVAEKEEANIGERLSDANDKLAVAGQSVSKTYKDPLQFAIATDAEKTTANRTAGAISNSEKICYTKISSKYYGIDPSTIRLYKKYDNSHPTSLADGTNISNNPTLMASLALPDYYPKFSLPNGFKFDESIITSSVVSKYKKCCGGDDATIRTKLINWVRGMNDLGSAVSIPNRWSGNKDKEDYKSGGKTKKAIDELAEDQIGWILYAAKQATIEKIHKNKFKAYAVTSITFNSTTYTLDVSKVKKTSNATEKTYCVKAATWNKLINLRRAWRLYMSPNLQSSQIPYGDSGDYPRQIRPDWNTSNNIVTINIDTNNSLYWAYQNSTAATLPQLWSVANTGMTYYAFLNSLGLYSIQNEILGFTTDVDSNGNLIKIDNILVEDDIDSIFMTCTYDPRTYYQNIVNIWNRKNNLAKADKEAYGKEQTELKNGIDALETLIRVKQKQKVDITAAFDRMMGPALRESYWQPENYHNYGDHYMEKPENFSMAYNEPSISDKSIPVFFWDKTLFTEEQKSYYECGVNRDKVYYSAINLKEFFNAYPSAKSVFFEHLDSICLAFYTDYYDKDSVNRQQVYADNSGQWWYSQTISHAIGEDYTFKTSEGNEPRMSYSNITDTVTQKVRILREEAKRKYYVIGGGLQFMFYKLSSDNNIMPVLIVTGEDELPDDMISYMRQSVYKANSSNNNLIPIRPGAQTMLGYMDNENNFQAFGYIKEANSSGNITHDAWISQGSTPEAVYPRIKINSLQVKRNDTAISCTNNAGLYDSATVLATPDHYSMFIREDYYLITLKPEIFYKTWGSQVSTVVNIATQYIFGNDTLVNPWNISYTISNGGTYVYLDAVSVLKENSVPKVEYTVTPNIKYSKISKTLYNYLDEIVMINDYELKLENAFGYISGITLNLDEPQEDEIDIKNYKNKFEDLFSSIAAETEEMKKNGGVLTALSSGVLSPVISNSIVQTVAGDLDNEDVFSTLNAYLAANFDGRKIVIDTLNEYLEEANALLAEGDEAFNEYADAAQESTNMFLSFVENIGAEVEPQILYGNPDSVQSNFKIGDILISPDGSRYVAVDKPGSSDPWMPHFRGFTSILKGANVEWNADTGIVNIMGENEINLNSGVVTIQANSKVNIFSNNEVNIQGADINIVSILDENAIESNMEGSINIFAVTYNSANSSYSYEEVPDPADTTTGIAGVFINANEIQMLGADITMRGANKILLQTSLGTANTTSAIQVSSENGIWIGTGADKGIRLYAVDGSTARYTQAQIGNQIAYTDANMSLVEILGNRILMGTHSNTTMTAVRILPGEFIIAAAANGSIGWQTTSQDDAVGSTKMGLRLTSSSFALAARDGATNTMSYFKLNGEGISLASTSTLNVNTGTYIQLSPYHFYLGSLVDISINANNLKLQTINGSTMFAVGQNLNSNGELTGNNVGLTFINNVLTVRGAIYATSGSFSGTINCGYISANNYNFTVDSSGNVNIKGSLTVGTGSSYMSYNNGTLSVVGGSISSSTITGGSITLNALSSGSVFTINGSINNQYAMQFNYDTVTAAYFQYYVNAATSTTESGSAIPVTYSFRNNDGEIELRTIYVDGTITTVTSYSQPFLVLSTLSGYKTTTRTVVAAGETRVYTLTEDSNGATIRLGCGEVHLSPRASVNKLFVRKIYFTDKTYTTSYGYLRASSKGDKLYFYDYDDVKHTIAFT